MIEQVIFTAGADDDIAEAYQWFHMIHRMAQTER